MAELSLRSMRAILVLNNQWSWSGGFATYLVWARGGTWRDIPYPPAPEGYWEGRATPLNTEASWDDYQQWASEFYSTPRAVELAAATVSWLLLVASRVFMSRRGACTNTGTLYSVV